MEPGESRVLNVDVTRPRPTLLGNFDRIPLIRLLTAVSFADAPSRSQRWTCGGYVDFVGGNEPGKARI